MNEKTSLLVTIYQVYKNTPLTFCFSIILQIFFCFSGEQSCANPLQKTSN